MYSLAVAVYRLKTRMNKRGEYLNHKRYLLKSCILSFYTALEKALTCKCVGACANCLYLLTEPP